MRAVLSMETYHAGRFAQAGIQDDFVQDNHSGSRQGTLRGLHYQIRQTQAKLVRVIAEKFSMLRSISAVLPPALGNGWA